VAGRYEIKRFIARGGMGEVYEAADDLLSVRVALKTVLTSSGASPRAIEQIRREVQVARAINHPGVCRVFDLGEHVPTGSGEGRRFFLTMEFLDGMTLGQQIRSGGALPPDRLLAIARQLADGLAAAHEVGVVHRDFKSDNVMLLPNSQGGVPRAVIMDFGLARGGPLSIGMASTGGIMVGSAAYMAPEQVQGGPVRPPADIYAFGVVLFEAATGGLPFLGATPMAMATKRLMEKPPSPRSRVPDLDPRIEEIILRCLAFMPEDRFPSMVDVRAALAAIEAPLKVDSAPVGQSRPSQPSAPTPPRARASRVWLTGVVVVLALAMLIGVKVIASRRVVSASAQPLPAALPAAPPPASPPVVSVPAPSLPPSSPPPPAAPPPSRRAAAKRLSGAAVGAPKTGSPEAAAPAEPVHADPRSRSRLDGFANPFQ
jgi:serine/threonine protein kinase